MNNNTDQDYQDSPVVLAVIITPKQNFSSTAFTADYDSQSAQEEHTPPNTHQRFSHDDTDLAL